MGIIWDYLLDLDLSDDMDYRQQKGNGNGVQPEDDDGILRWVCLNPFKSTALVFAKRCVYYISLYVRFSNMLTSHSTQTPPPQPHANTTTIAQESTTAPTLTPGPTHPWPNRRNGILGLTNAKKEYYY